MSGKTLKIDLRRRAILEILAREHSVTVAQLSQALNATAVTIRTDLSALEAENRLRRVRGGAVRIEAGACYGDRSEEKQAIGRAFCACVREGDRLFINSGTTSRAVAGALRQFSSLAIVTNSPPVAAMLVDRFHVILLGGDMSSSGEFAFGDDALRQLERYQTDWAVLSVDSISVAEGVTLSHPEESPVSRAMLERARRGVIVADHAKIRRAGFVRLCDAAAPLMLVTDAASDPGELAALKGAGMSVLLA